MRVILAGIAGGIVVFIWGFVSHVLLPIGEMGMKQPTNEDVVLEAAKAGLPESGVYYLPSIGPDKMQDEAAMKAWGEKSKTSPYTLIVYQTEGRDGTDMGPMLITEGITNVASALVAALIASFLARGTGGRILAITGLGFFAWLTVNVPYWNWYRFPMDFTEGQAIAHVVGWLLGGIAIALILPKRD